MCRLVQLLCDLRAVQHILYHILLRSSFVPTVIISKLSGCEDHLPVAKCPSPPPISHQEGFTYHTTLWGRWDHQSPPNRRHRNMDWYQGRALHTHTHTHPKFWMHFRHKIVHFLKTCGALKTHSSAVINSKELNQLLQNIQTKPTQKFLAPCGAVFFNKKSQ